MLPEVREMLAEDIDEVVRIENAVQHRPWSRNSFRNCLDENHENLVIVQGGRVSAYAILLKIPPQAELHNICVARDQQGRGLGKALVGGLVRRCIEERVVEIYLEVRDGNVAARAFYEHIGFVGVGSRPNYYPSGQDGREAAKIMCLTL